MAVDLKDHTLVLAGASGHLATHHERKRE